MRVATLAFISVLVAFTLIGFIFGSSVFGLIASCVISAEPISLCVHTIRRDANNTTFDIRVTNGYESTIRVVGIQASCNCTSISKLPLSINARGQGTFQVSVENSKSVKRSKTNVLAFIEGPRGIDEVPIALVSPEL